MSLPPYIYVDRRLESEDVTRDALESRQLTPFEGDERLERLHRILYPAFRVTMRYETGKGKLIGTEEKEETVFLDGLWADNHADIGKYAAETDSLLNVATGDYDLGREQAGIGRSVLLEFQVSNDEAASLVPDGVSDYEEMTNFGHGDKADVFLRTFRESKGLPGDFDPDGFQEMTEVTRIYLPFWLAEFRSDDSEKALMLSFRDVGLDREAITRHGWLSGFVADDPTRLADYGYEVRLDRVEAQLSEDDEDVPGDQPGVQDPAGRSPDRSFGGGDGSGTGGAGGEVTQPEDVDMEAESLVEQRVDRGFGDVGGMDDLKQTLEHKVVRPLEDPEAFEEYGIGVVNGVLLHGPPGCGETSPRRSPGNWATVSSR